MTPQRYPEDFALEPDETPRVPVELTLMEVMALQDMTRNAMTYEGWYIGGPLCDALADAKARHMRRRYLDAHPALRREVRAALDGAFPTP